MTCVQVDKEDWSRRIKQVRIDANRLFMEAMCITPEHLVEVETAQKLTQDKSNTSSAESDVDTDSDETNSVSALTSTWAKCRQPPLTASQRVGLQEAIQNCGCNINTQPAIYYAFVHRVAKTYVSAREDNELPPAEDMHEDRDTVCYNCVTAVMEEIPEHERPHNGDVDAAAKLVLPILEDLFQMPGRGPAEGSPQWISTMQSNPHLITFEMMDKYDSLMRTYLKHCDRISPNDNGYPELKPKEQDMFSQNGRYKSPKYKAVPRNNVLKGTRRLMGRHPCFKFMRNGGVLHALARCKDANEFPYKMKPEHMPVDSATMEPLQWCNYSRFIRRFDPYG